MIQTQVQVSVDAGRGAFPGSVRRLSTQGAQAIFRDDLCQPLVEGQMVDLVFASIESGVMVATRARVEACQEQAPLRSYTFRFDPPEPRMKELVRPTTDRRNRRRLSVGEASLSVSLVVDADIVAMLPDIPGTAVMENEDLWVEGRIRDVSPTGLAVQVEHWAQAAFLASDRVRVVIGPEDSMVRMQIEARIRHRKPDGDDFIYGLEFDWDHTEDGDIQRQLLVLNISRLNRATTPTPA